MISATFQSGNLQVTATVTGSSEWSKDAVKRIYHEVRFEGKRQPISKFYEVVSGSTRDDSIEIGGRVFGYQLAQCDSRAKREAAIDAVRALAQQIIA